MAHTKQLPPTPVRLPPDLKHWLIAQAGSNLRSVNAEVVAILMAERRRQNEHTAQQ